MLGVVGLRLNSLTSPSLQVLFAPEYAVEHIPAYLRHKRGTSAL